MRQGVTSAGPLSKAQSSSSFLPLGLCCAVLCCIEQLRPRPTLSQLILSLRLPHHIQVSIISTFIRHSWTGCWRLHHIMALSHVSSKSIVFLLGLLYLQAHTVDASISTSAGFPQDVFAKPAFQIDYESTPKGAFALPIKCRDALNIMEQQEASSSSSSPSHPTDLAPLSSSLSLPGQRDLSSSRANGQSPRILSWSLERSSPTEFQLCSIPDFNDPPVDQRPNADRGSASATTSRSRHDLILHAKSLLDPLKKVCLYHTAEWFTYSFCHGREIRQFRQLGPTVAAAKAFKAAGGGEAGKKAAMDAAEKVNNAKHPIADPEYPAFILGRWTPQNEDVVGDDRSHALHQQQPLTDSTGSLSHTAAASSQQRGLPSHVNTAGMDLVEEVQFGDWDEEELFAAEAKALAQFKESPNNAVEKSRDAPTYIAHESQRRRYVTQRWTNGTMCDMNHQPRTVEVQFHCSERKPLEDRIVVFKETTICNYVLIIETPRLCADPAFGKEKEEDPLTIRCHRVVSDDYTGPTLGDPDRVPLPSLSEVEGDSKMHDHENKGHVTAASEAEGSSTTSHTYGDLSRYESVHDDYYDEALGGPGALYQQYQQEFEHGHVHDHDHADELQEAEILVEVGQDENGQLVINKVLDPASDTLSTPVGISKEGRRRESGKKRSDDHEDADAKEDHPLGIQLDIDDFLSVLNGDQGVSLEKKLAEKISEALSKQMQQQTFASSSSPNDDDDDDGDEVADDAMEARAEAGKNKYLEKKKTQSVEDVAKLYQRLMAGVTGDVQKASGEGGKMSRKKPQGKGRPGEGQSQSQSQGQGQGQQSGLRMEKVGDSLSERVKRFYEAQKREQNDAQQPQQNDQGADQAPPIHQHLEL